MATKKYYRRPSNETIIEALEKNCGIIAQTARALKVSRNTLASWIKEDPELQEALEKAKEQMIDIAECALLKNIKEGKETSIIFFLKTRGKKRGYSEKMDHNLEGDIQIKIKRD
ncbi:hypothetical protein JCM13304A_09410 [Desulfothermus okinawensis JCM 13304]